MTRDFVPCGDYVTNVGRHAGRTFCRSQTEPNRLESQMSILQKQLMLVCCTAVMALGGNGQVLAQFGGGRAERGADEEQQLTDEPAETITVTLWILRISDTEQLPADELAANLVEHAFNLPPNVGTVDEVRDLITRMKVAGILRDARELRITALDGQAVQTQRGSNMPRVIATSVDPRAGRVNSLQMEPVGTLVELRPRIDSNRNIQVSLKMSASQMEKSKEIVMAEPVGGSPAFADVVTTRQFNTAASLKSGSAVLLQSETLASPKSEIDLIILGATILPTE